MASVAAVDPVKLICGVIASSDEAWDRARAMVIGAVGTIDTESERYPFDATDYYQKEMGAPLFRRFVTFETLVDPGCLAGIKNRTNDIEAALAVHEGSVRRRRVNLDPGYVTGASLVLATTKNFAHRIYLRDGIYAEVTLLFRKEGLSFFEWTYPDFRSGRYTPFLLQVRKKYLEQARQASLAYRPGQT